jgi:hypothetical protein
MKICYIILTCEKFLPTRAAWQNDTFLKNVDEKDVYFLSGKPDGSNIYGWYTPDTYEGCPMKYMCFFRNMTIEYDWYVFIDDDTFVNTKNLRDYLKMFDVKQKYYIGSERHEHNLHFMSGGAGICITHSIYKEIIEYVTDRKFDELYFNYNGDVTLGSWINKFKDILFIDDKRFSATKHTTEEQLDDFFTFHYLKSKEEFEFYHKATIRCDYNFIINDYLKPYKKITREDVDFLINTKNEEGYLMARHFKIIDNKLYIDKRHVEWIFCKETGKLIWDTRIEAFKFMLLKTMEKYKINDVDFTSFHNDSIQESNKKYYLRNGNPLPIFCTTSTLKNYDIILCPDFTFSFSPEYCISNAPKIFSEISQCQRNIKFEDKIPQMIYRGSMCNPYRKQYARNDKLYNICSADNTGTDVGGWGVVYSKPEYLTYLEKSYYKYHLHLNGHCGNENDGAYSSAFKFGLMSKSLVFYSAPVMYYEFFQHPRIFRENEHFIYTKDPIDLENKYKMFLNNEKAAEKIATNAYNFCNDYLNDYDNVTYYMQKLLNEYAKIQTFVPEIDPINDVLVENVMYNKHLSLW